jgi:hypothetical protein
MLLEIPDFSPAEQGGACARDAPDANGRAAYYSRKRDMEYGRGAGPNRVKDRRLHAANSGHDWLVGTCRVTSSGLASRLCGVAQARRLVYFQTHPP